MEGAHGLGGGQGEGCGGDRPDDEDCQVSVAAAINDFEVIYIIHDIISLF